MMLKRILVGLAGTSYTPVAIQRAVMLAKAHNAEITGVTVLDTRRISMLGGTAPMTCDTLLAGPDSRLAITQTRMADSIQSFEVTCRAAGIKHHVVSETGDAFSRLLDLARYHDLMVFGLRSVFEYDFLGDSPESILIRLIGNGARPLIAVTDKFRSISRVLIAYSGSMESATAMKRFVQMRLWPELEIRIVTFHPDKQKASELLRDAEAYCRSHGFSVSHQSNPGDPKVLLLAAATMWKADMIVMGNSARNVLMRKLLGDTLRETLHDTDIPLFLAQ
jgi:nucleotide-binding universal stress UspA family protein